MTDELVKLAAASMRRIAANREAYVSAWLAETGLLPSQCEIVEQLTEQGVVVTIRPRARGRDSDVGAT
jgi:hypothetical protein